MGGNNLEVTPHHRRSRSRVNCSITNTEWYRRLALSRLDCNLRIVYVTQWQKGVCQERQAWNWRFYGVPMLSHHSPGNRCFHHHTRYRPRPTETMSRRRYPTPPFLKFVRIHVYTKLTGDRTGHQAFRGIRTNFTIQARTLFGEAQNVTSDY